MGAAGGCDGAGVELSGGNPGVKCERFPEFVDYTEDHRVNRNPGLGFEGRVGLQSSCL
jgi:hypothetical protein